MNPIILILLIFAAMVLVLGIVEFALNKLLEVIPGARQDLALLAGCRDTWWWDYYPGWAGEPSGRFAFCEHLWQAFLYRGIDPSTGALGTGTKEEPAKLTVYWFIGQLKGAITWLADKITEALESVNITITADVAQALAIFILVVFALLALYALWRLIT